MDPGKWIWLVALAALLCCGCSGILAEKVEDNGQTQSLRLGTTEKWSTWDQNARKQDDSCIMLNNEWTF